MFPILSLVGLAMEAHLILQILLKHIGAITVKFFLLVESENISSR